MSNNFESLNKSASDRIQFFEVDEGKTTIPEGMCTSFRVDCGDLKIIEATTASIDDERPYIGIKTLRHHDVVVIR